MAPETPLLDRIKSISDLRLLEDHEVMILAEEVRQEMIDAVSQTGGHLGAGLGVVELTVALHHVFNTPKDRLIFDVGHQAYPHKIITGRRDRMRTIRKEGGLSGFTKRTESEFDPFGAGHSSTSISAGLGMAKARDLQDCDNHVISVIGDGAMSAGLAFEALNNAGHEKSKLIVILNDNDMSIAPPTGAMSHYLAKLWSGRNYGYFRETVKNITRNLPSGMEMMAKRFEEYTKGMAVGGTLFEELGFNYFGPIDGHDLAQLLPVLRNLRDTQNGPVLLHCVTQKGKGYAPAEESADRFHGVSAFDKETGNSLAGKKSNKPSYTKVFAEELIHQAQRDPKIVAITAAMPSGTGLDLFGKAFPDRCFDVGIAEQHAVTFAAGLASEGFRPFCAIYSTFLQRAYDQIIHDVAIQNLPVRFAIDRAGLVGADGATHAGSFDIAYLNCLPNMVVMASSDEEELRRMVATAAAYDDGPIAFRYNRGEGPGVERTDEEAPLVIGKGRVIQKGEKLAVVNFGGRLSAIRAAAEQLALETGPITIIDARFAKPLDQELILQAARDHGALLTVEEGSSGGFGDAVNRLLLEHGVMDQAGLVLRNAYFDDRYLDHAAPETQFGWTGLDEAGLKARIREILSLA